MFVYLHMKELGLSQACGYPAVLYIPKVFITAQKVVKGFQDAYFHHVLSFHHVPSEFTCPGYGHSSLS